MTQEQEPVMRVKVEDGCWMNTVSQDLHRLANGEHDLFAAPPQRKPLTDEQIMANDVLRYHFALNGGAGPISKQGRKVIDAIEAAHGIKE